MSLQQLQSEYVALTLKLIEISEDSALREELSAKLKAERYSTAAANGHRKNKAREAEIKATYLQGRFPSKSAAAVKLAKRFNLSHRTIEKYLSKL